MPNKEDILDNGLTARIEAAIAAGMAQGQAELARKRRRKRQRGWAAGMSGLLLVCCLLTIRVSPGFAACTGEDAREVKWRTAKTEELMAYLVHHRGEAVDRYRILDALWGDEAEKTASYFNTTVHYLKKSLRSIGIDNVLHYNRGCYRLDVSAFDCDYVAFYRQLAAGEQVRGETIARWESASKLYTGRYLEDNDYAWAEQARISIETDYISLTQNIADYYKSAGDFGAAIVALKRALKLVSWSEDLHVRLIKAYLASDDRAAALKQYDAMSVMLRTEYLMEPGEDLRRILQIS